MSIRARMWNICGITYNVNKRLIDPQSTTNVETWLENESPFFEHCELIAVGLQEVPLVHNLLGATSQTWSGILNRGFYLLAGLITNTGWMSRHELVLLHQVNLAQNSLLVYSQRKVLPKVKSISENWSRDHMGGLTGLKGSIAIKILFMDASWATFVTSHFIAGDSYAADRISYSRTVRCTFSGAIEGDADKMRFVLWMGDFNSRTNGFNSSAATAQHFESASDPELCEIFKKGDQLRESILEGAAFHGFTEKEITFKPTYRYMVGSGALDPRRVPSWCDRVLYKGELKVERYTSYRGIAVSDHHPVTFVAASEMPPPNEDWRVVFEHIPTWSNSIPLFCKFNYLNDFWRVDGSYRDWVMIYPAEIQSISSPLRWLNILVTYEDYNRLTVAEFASLEVGLYRVGYYSYRNKCLVGLSDAFEVKDFTDQ